MAALVLAHAMTAILAVPLVRWLGPRAFWALAMAPAGAVAWLIGVGPQIVRDGALREHWSWLPDLGISVDFLLDPLAWVMSLVVFGVGSVVLFYCAGYFAENEPGTGRFAAYLTGFAGSMFALVVADDLIVLFVAWEITTVLSFLLVGHQHKNRASRAAATQALVITATGGLALLAAAVLLGQSLETYRLSEVLPRLDELGSGQLITIAVLLILAVMTKSAVVPLHFWLPAAMTAPTPASAYLHAAAMVKAGVYLVARFSPELSQVTWWPMVWALLGGCTFLYGSWMALRQNDAKQLVAFGTVSQLGLLIALFGLGQTVATTAATVLLVAHALYKSTAFLTIGVVDKATGTRDLRELNAVWRQLKAPAAGLGLAVLAMAGLPPALSFVGKELSLTAALNAFPTLAWSGALGALVIVAGGALTVAYSARLWWGLFGSGPDLQCAPTPVKHVAAEARFSPIVGAVAGIGAMAATTWLTPWLTGDFTHHPALALWHGLNLELLLSLVSWVIGVGLWWRWGRVRPGSGTDRQREGLGSRFYDGATLALDLASLKVTTRLQRGSLPQQIGLVAMVAFALPLSALVWKWSTGNYIRWSVTFFDSPLVLGVAAITALGALGAALSHKRFQAIILVGLSGYGTALMYLFYGGPDLALTQVLVETMTMVLFVLALRQLPINLPATPRSAGRWLRPMIGVLSGVSVTVFAVVAGSSRAQAPLSQSYPQAAVDQGGGHNVVNVILVDMRAWDTFGEISVLLTAAAGVASLVFQHQERVVVRRQVLMGHRHGRRERALSATRPWLVTSRESVEQRRQVLLHITIRLLFHSMILISIYFLLCGHNAPGGGFAGGLVCGLAIVCRYVAGGRRELGEAFPMMPSVLLGGGLSLAALYATIGLVWGSGPLESWVWDVHLMPGIDLHVASSTIFDIGVYLLVLGLVVELVQTFGSEIDRLMFGDLADRR